MQSHAYNQLKHHIAQPVFKLTTSSVCPSPSSSYLSSPNGSKSTPHGNQLNIRPVNSPSSSYFRPSTPRQKEKENEKAEKERKQSAERIQSLHTRLHQEAEKIRKWKTSTEIEMKEKVITSDVIESYDSFLVYENKAVGVKVIKNQKDKHILRETDRDELQFEEKRRFEQFQARIIFIGRKLL
ncbi:PREDICTED: uncharacterized protein LOC107339830 [Acropora digitifera]|uniref:uncharacterized protein LOC107339830 n=1 Tax=Acropora digitifera TaxID=70779 RepID=UPI00077ADBF4|nr:PREDICTED: uncharacterized protein LOC107339830 [Acropora digitifera]